jgi:hypothetical protein
MSMSDQERQHVRNMLEASGFPLEVEMSSFLERRKWAVAPSIFYQDLDQKDMNLREIDILASRTHLQDSTGKRFEPYELHLALVVECKKSKDFNWVFYTRPIERNKMFFPPVAPYSTGLLYTDFAEHAKARSLFSAMLPTQMILIEQQYGPQRGILPPHIARQVTDSQQMGIARAENIRCLSEGERAIQYEEAPRKNRPNDLSIYIVARDLWKAAWDEVTLTKRIMNGMFELISRGPQAQTTQMRWPLYLFLPIIIFDGPMWKWVEKERTVEKINQVVLQVQLTSQNYPSPSALVCAVHRDRAFQLIAEIEEDLEKISDKVAANFAALDHERQAIETGIRFDHK